MEYIGSIDQGTTSTRFILFSKDGDQVASHQVEHKQIMPQKGYVEHDPLEIWNNTVICINETMKKSNIPKDSLKAIGITNQRETTICWSRKSGKPLYNAVVWMDMRSQNICDDIVSTLPDGADSFKKITGLPISPYFAATKISWLLKNIPEIQNYSETSSDDICFGTIDSWLMFKLSGHSEFLTDVTNASRYLLMDLKSLTWDEKLLQFWNIKKEWLPTISPSAEVLFEVSSVESVEGVPVSGIVGDQQAALLGQLCVEKNSLKNTYGTGCFLLYNTGEEIIYSKNGLLSTVVFMKDNKPTYGLEGSVAIGGAVIQWLRDNLEIIKDAKESEALAKSVDDNGGIYFVPAFSGLYAPYWRSDARGAIVGMTRFVRKGHFARAALEAVAFQVNDLIDAMKKDVNVESLEEVKVDGGMVRNELLLQFQSDISQVKIVVPKVIETTAIGAAFAAGLGVGIYKDFEDLKGKWKFGKKVEPQMDEGKRVELCKGWKKAVKRTLSWTDENETLDIV
eukprot:maker-scaffold_5-snap-gene-0.2-mRNA-1 protein AED:0.02 eAED:0.02 QI:37/1/1/1/1/1/2/71/508